MKNINNFNKKNISDPNSNRETIDINLYDLIDGVVRRKIYFFSTFFICILLGFIKTFDKPIWQGEFQIVIKSTNRSSGGLNDITSGESILSFLNLGNLDKDLNTEVKILESPSILNPIFNFVKEEKNLKNKNKNIKFKKWKESLKVELVDGTSVLNLKYIDNDKSIIIPVLTKLSSAYQGYSNRDRQRSLNQGINYLTEQSLILKKTSQNSFNKLIKFNIKNNNFSLNEINEFNKTLLSSDESFPLGSELNLNYSPDGAKLDLISKLETLALEKSAIFKQDSQYMTQLNQKIKNLKDSISKPTENLIEYRNLRKRAIMDEIMSSNIDRQLEILKLERAKQEDPWELISEPTLMDDPVGPRKLLIMALSTLSGIFLGIIISLFIDKKTKLIFNINQIKDLIPYPFFRKISIKNKDNFDKLLRIILKNNVNIKEIVLLPLVDDNFIKELLDEISFINQNLKDRKVIISSDIENNKDKKHILIIRKSKSSISLLEEYLKDVELLSISILGWVFLE